MFFDDFCNKRVIKLNSFESSFWGKLHLDASRLKVYTEASEKQKKQTVLILTYVVCMCVYVV